MLENRGLLVIRVLTFGRVKRKILILFLVLAMLGRISPLTIKTAKASTSLSPFKKGEILIKFKKNASDAKINEIILKIECLRVRNYAGGIFRVKIPSNRDVFEAKEELNQSPDVEIADLNYILDAETIPNDIYFKSQWALAKISASAGWDTEIGGASPVVVAVVDTGVDLGHPDLKNKTVEGYDFINNDTAPMDDNGHGTHVAGIIGSETNNLEGVSGVSWGARIMPIKALNSSGSGTDLSVASGIRWAVDHGARIINLSLGSPGSSFVLKDAIDYAYSKGAILVAAAGNNGSNGNLPEYPAAYDHVIAVSATDSLDNKAGFSNFGSYIDVAAPGVDILSTSLGGGYGYKSGTSTATPFVSGLASLLLSRSTQLASDQIEQIIGQSADDFGTAGKDDLYGFGRINIFNALRAPYGDQLANNANSQGSSTGEIYGRVINSLGQAVPGAVVRIDNSIMPTNFNGEFRFTMVGNGVYKIYYDAPGYSGQAQEGIMVNGNTAVPPLVIMSQGGGEIYGRVINSLGQAVPGAVVRIDNSIMPTNFNGEFRFTMVGSGVYKIYYDASGYSGQVQEGIMVDGSMVVPPMVIMSQ
ncbi:MAG: S8 family serine peptidase [Actinobacteria bacterium]|nr:S8 family serine peptidase [Actinomycetota bacterium]